MKRKKKVTLHFILIALIPAGVILYWILSPVFISTEKFYYIAEAGMYIKIVKPVMSTRGYIYLSPDSTFLPAQMDCIIVRKSETANINLIINPSIKKELYLNDRFNFATYYQKKYKISKIDFRNAKFFSEENISSVRVFLLKCPYIKIAIDGYLESVYIKKCDEEYPNKIEPIANMTK